jgi:hypothetical protein
MTFRCLPFRTLYPDYEMEVDPQFMKYLESLKALPEAKKKEIRDRILAEAGLILPKGEESGEPCGDNPIRETLDAAAQEQTPLRKLLAEYDAMTEEQRQAHAKGWKEEIARRKQAFDDKKKAELEERQVLLKKYGEQSRTGEWPKFFWGLCKWCFWVAIIYHIGQHFSCTWIKYTP